MIEIFQFLTSLGLGFILGLKHALDADHVVAVSTITSQTNSLRKASVLGVAWGIGHTITLLLSGLLILLLKLTIPEKLALSFEFIVGIVLAFLGTDVILKAIRERQH